VQSPPVRRGAARGARAARARPGPEARRWQPGDRAPAVPLLDALRLLTQGALSGGAPLLDSQPHACVRRGEPLDDCRIGPVGFRMKTSPLLLDRLPRSRIETLIRRHALCIAREDIEPCVNLCLLVMIVMTLFRATARILEPGANPLVFDLLCRWARQPFPFAAGLFDFFARMLRARAFQPFAQRLSRAPRRGIAFGDSTPFCLRPLVLRDSVVSRLRQRAKTRRRLLIDFEHWV
jgi:hypothetical protein